MFAAIVSHPMRVVGVFVIALLLYQAVSTLNGILIALSVVLWILILLALLYDHGRLNALSSVPVLSSLLGSLTNRTAANSSVKASSKAKLSESERRELFTNAQNELAHLVGIDNVLEQINQKLLEMARAAQHAGKRGFGTQSPSLMVVIVGPRGVGKTTVAKCIGKLYAGLGLLKSAKTVAVKSTDLRRSSMRSLSEAGERFAEAALDGVLLLDDADWLTNRDPYDRSVMEGVDFGMSVLDVVERHPQRILILATLSEAAEQRLRADQEHARWLGKLAIRSIFMDNLQEDTLLQILCNFLSIGGLTLDEDSEMAARGLLQEYQAIQGNTFDNALACRRLADRLHEVVFDFNSGNPRESRIIIQREHIAWVRDNLE